MQPAHAPRPRPTRTRAKQTPPIKVAEAMLEGAAACEADGVVGESAWTMAGRLEARLAAAGPGAGSYDAVVILGGTNDLWRCDPAAVAAKLDAVHAVCREALPEADIGICTVPRWCPGVVSGARGARLGRAEGRTEARRRSGRRMEASARTVQHHVDSTHRLTF